MSYNVKVSINQAQGEGGAVIPNASSTNDGVMTMAQATKLDGVPTLGGVGDYGDGSDGDVALVGGSTTLVRDMYYNTLTLTAGAALHSAGFKIFVRGKLSVASGCIINHSGAAGSPTAAGLGAALGSVGGGTDGGAGQLNDVGLPGTNVATGGSLGGGGGHGGNCVTHAGGVAGTQAATGVGYGSFRDKTRMLLAKFEGLSGVLDFLGGTGGGAGGSDDAGNKGAGGGGGGGVLFIACAELDNKGTLGAKGGNGGSTVAAVNISGGGGGGGGFVGVVTSKVTNLGTVTAAGGTGGTGHGTGASGTAGSDGTTLVLSV